MMYQTVAKKMCSSEFLRELAHKAVCEFRATYKPGQLGAIGSYWPPLLPTVRRAVNYADIFHPVLDRKIGLLPQKYHNNNSYTIVGKSLAEAWVQVSLYARYPHLYAEEVNALADIFASTEHTGIIAQHLQLHTMLDHYMPAEDRDLVQDWTPVYADTFWAYMGAIGCEGDADGVDLIFNLIVPCTRILDRLLRERVSDPQIAERLVYNRPDPATLSIPDFPPAAL